MITLKKDLVKRSKKTLQHTQGHWYVVKDEWGEPCIIKNRYSIIAITSDTSKNEANARRIVACVNACESIPTEVLENNIIKKIFESLEESVKAMKKMDVLLLSITDSKKKYEKGEITRAKVVIAKVKSIL
jgi:enoyl-[acyl-carrier-protein] reductase (NADH)